MARPPVVGLGAMPVMPLQALLRRERSCRRGRSDRPDPRRSWPPDSVQSALGGCCSGPGRISDVAANVQRCMRRKRRSTEILCERNRVSSRSSVPSPTVRHIRIRRPPRRKIYGFRYCQYPNEPGLSRMKPVQRAGTLQSITIKVTLIVVLKCAPVSTGNADRGCGASGRTEGLSPSDFADRAPGDRLLSESGTAAGRGRSR
jgi:hypothetical protein